MTYRVLIDASNLHVGGGVQVAASFINELISMEEPPNWVDFADIRVSMEVAGNLTRAATSRVVQVNNRPFDHLKRFFGKRYEVAFRIFGPHYGFREATVEIVGFADPYIPPNWAPQEITPATWRSKLKYLIKRNRAKTADQIWVESSAYANSLTQIGLRNSAIHVVPNTVSNTVLANRARDSEPVLQHIPRPKEAGAVTAPPEARRLHLLYPARPYAHKNHKILSEIVTTLKSYGYSVNIDLTLTTSEVTNLLPDIEDAVTPLGIINQTDLAKAYMRADLVIFPTLLEVSSATPLEAMALGKPLLASDRQFIREQAGEAAWYFDPTQPADIAKTIHMAASDASERQRKIDVGLEIAAAAPTAVDRLKAFLNIIEKANDPRSQNNPPRVVVAHPVQQHSMHLAAALKESGVETTYCTPIYDRPGSLTSKLGGLLSQNAAERARARRHEGLSDDEIVQKVEVLALVLLALQRVKATRAPFNWWLLLLEIAFGRLAAIEAVASDVFITYDTFGTTPFRYLARKSPRTIRVLDMSAPSSPYTEEILAAIARDARDDGRLADSLSATGTGFLAAIRRRRAIQEIENADHFLVASRFTAKSLTSLGEDASKIHYCIYGSPIISPRERTQEDFSSERLRIAFVGSAVGRKGITTFIDAAERLSHLPLDFVVIGHADHGSNLLRSSAKIEYTGHLIRHRVLDELEKSQIMVFPSLADGFGLSALEAMAAGCAVVCSNNAGIADLIDPEDNGLLFEAGHSSELVAHISRLHDDRALLQRLSIRARETAKERDWFSYNKDVGSALQEILGEA